MFANNLEKFPMQLTKIYGLEKFDTSNVVLMEGMFQLCASMKNINLGNFNTSNKVLSSFVIFPS